MGIFVVSDALPFLGDGFYIGRLAGGASSKESFR